MICVHLLEIEVLFTYRADTLLLFVDCAGIFLVKLTQAQIFFFSCQQILIYTAILGDFLVCHENGYFCFQCSKIKYIALVLMIEPSPIQSLHLLTPLREMVFTQLITVWKYIHSGAAVLSC